MKSLKKVFAAILVCIICSSGICIDANASENNIWNEDYNEDLELILIKEDISGSTRVTGTGYTHNFQYIVPSTGQVVCRFSMTVGFSYDYDDGMARITTFTYSVSYVASGYTIGNFNKSITSPDNPAKATLTYTIYHNGVYLGKGTSEARCYNTGSISWY